MASTDLIRLCGGVGKYPPRINLAQKTKLVVPGRGPATAAYTFKVSDGNTRTGW